MANFNFNQVNSSPEYLGLVQRTRDDNVQRRIESRRDRDNYIKLADEGLNLYATMSLPLDKALLSAQRIDAIDKQMVWSSPIEAKAIKAGISLTEAKNKYGSFKTIVPLARIRLGELFVEAYKSTIKTIVPNITYFKSKSPQAITDAIANLEKIKLVVLSEPTTSFLNSFSKTRKYPLEIVMLLNETISALESVVPEKMKEQEKIDISEGEQMLTDEATIAKSEAFQEKLPLYLGIGGAAIAALLLIKGS